MIYDYNTLRIIYKNYSNINQKISIECKKVKRHNFAIRIRKNDISNNLYDKSIKARSVNIDMMSLK